MHTTQRFAQRRLGAPFIIVTAWALAALAWSLPAAAEQSELRIAKAQLVGWLEGLFHGIQATLFAQQLAARQQLEQMRQLPPGAMGPGGPGGMPPQPGDANDRPGTYL